jgi:hypothetical protein
MKPPVGTTFVVAASLLGVAAVAQLVAVLVYFGPGMTTRQPVASAPEPTPAATPVAVVPASTPVAPATPPAVSDEEKSRLADLIKEAETLEGGANPGAALVPLEEAVTLQPSNPEILARLARLQGRLGQNELAAATWKAIVDLGPAAGTLLSEAEVRLRLLEQGNGAPSGGPELRDQVGLQPGSTLGVIDLQLKDDNASGNAVKDLRLAIKARPNEPVDGRDVRINVTFYETVNGEVVPTMSRVQSMWFTTPVDWKDEGIEILEVKYEVPRIGPDGGPPPDYYGYMVNIYHRGELQDTRSEPVDLQEMFPPPLSEIPDGPAQ